MSGEMRPMLVVKASFLETSNAPPALDAANFAIGGALVRPFEAAAKSPRQPTFLLQSVTIFVTPLGGLG